MYRQNKEKKDAQVSGQIGSVDEGLPQGAHVLHPSISKHGLFDHEPAGSISVRHLQGILVGDNTDEEEHQGGRHQVQRRAADGLVGTQVDRGKAQKQREQRAEGRRDQHREKLHALQRDPVAALLEGEDGVARLQNAHEPDADERAEDHDTFERQVDDTAALGEHARKRHDHQRDGINERLLNEKCHFASPPFSVSACAPAGAGTAAGAGSALASAPSSFFLPSLPIHILMTSEKALRYTMTAMMTFVMYS